MSREEEILGEKLARKKRFSMNGRRWVAFAVIAAACFYGCRRLSIPQDPPLPTPPQALACAGKEKDLREASVEFEAGEFSQALDISRPLAEAGCAPAQVLLAGMTAEGLGVGKSAAKAVELYEKAAASGYVPALVALGDSYYSGKGLAPSPEAAYESYARAAELGGGMGLWNAAELLGKGGFQPPGGLPPEQKRLLSAAEKHALAGDAPSALFLGQVYEYGRLGAKTDGPAAYGWYARAGQAGNVYARWRAALMCHYGRGVPTDYPLALRWYQSAARGGSGQARLRVAFLLSHGGPGIRRDIPQALRWLFMGPARAPYMRVNSGPLSGAERYF